MIKIEIATVSNEDKISKPQRPIKLDQYTGLESKKAWELANLIRIAATDYKCFNNWFNDHDISEIENGGKSQEFTLEKDRELEGIEQTNNNTWIYANKDLESHTIKEYYLLTDSDIEDQEVISQFTGDKFYKYRILKTYEYMAYYPAKLDVDIDRFGFILEREEGEKKFVFIVFRGTRESAEWFNNAQFKQVDFLANDEDIDGVENYGKISLGFNKMYTGFRPGILIDYDNLNEFSRRSDAFFRRIIEKIDNVKIKYKSIYQAINEYLASDNLDTNTNIYITGHSLGGALATIATMHITAQDQLQNPINLYSFASPRVGDNIFADKFNQLVSQDKIKAFRFANSEDIVTKVPFPVWFKTGIDLNNPLLDLTRSTFNRVTGGIFDKDYQHVGTPVYFTHQARRSDGNEIYEPTATVGDNHNMTTTYCGALEKK